MSATVTQSLNNKMLNLCCFEIKYNLKVKKKGVTCSFS